MKIEKDIEIRPVEKENLVFDLGYSNAKLPNVQFPAIVGTGRKIRFSTGFDFRSFVDDMRINYNGVEYFVGDLARRQSDQVFFDLNEDRYNSDATQILMKTCLGLLAKENEITYGTVVTGLPLDYLKYKDELRNMLETDHSIELNGGERKVIVDKSVIIPQPMAVFFDMLLDDEGNVIDKSLANKTIGIVDIGFGTTDLAYVRNMEFIDKYSRSRTVAMHTVHEFVAEKIADKFNVTKEIYEIEEAIRSHRIKIKDSTYDISKVVEKAYSTVATKIVEVVNATWKNREDIDMIVLAGGGSIAMEKYLVDALDANLIFDAQFAILRGYQKLGRKIQKDVL